MVHMKEKGWAKKWKVPETMITRLQNFSLRKPAKEELRAKP